MTHATEQILLFDLAFLFIGVCLGRFILFHQLQREWLKIAAEWQKIADAWIEVKRVVEVEVKKITKE